MAQPTMQADPDPAGAPLNQLQDASQGICIEIQCLPDGTFNVSSESLQEEAQEENAGGDAGQGEAGSEAGQPANSIAEAMKLALNIYKQTMGGGDSEQQSAQSAFQANRGQRGNVQL